MIQVNSKQKASVGEESISMSPPNRDVSWTVLPKESPFVIGYKNYINQSLLRVFLLPLIHKKHKAQG